MLSPLLHIFHASYSWLLWLSYRSFIILILYVLAIRFNIFTPGGICNLGCRFLLKWLCSWDISLLWPVSAYVSDGISYCIWACGLGKEQRADPNLCQHPVRPRRGEEITLGWRALSTRLLEFIVQAGYHVPKESLRSGPYQRPSHSHSTPQGKAS